MICTQICTKCVQNIHNLDETAEQFFLDFFLSDDIDPLNAPITLYWLCEWITWTDHSPCQETPI